MKEIGRIKISDILSVTNNDLLFYLNESDAHEVINHINFVQGIFYKIVCYKKGDSLYSTMKHGYVHPDCRDEYGEVIREIRTKSLFTNRWLKADIKLVADGSINRDTNYISGWHLFSDYNKCRYYFEKFKHKDSLTIIKCRACGISKKEHSKNEVWLAEEIYIPSDQYI